MSSHDAYAEPERGRTLTVVLLALLILTVIGALFGFVLGRREGGDPASGAGDGQSAGPSKVVTPQGEQCPKFIQDGVAKQTSSAALPVSLVLWIRTDKREVWICKEADGSGLWYQGHEKKKNFYPDEIPVEGDNGLLVSRVTNAGNDKYIAINVGTTYTVTADKLVVVTGNQSLEDPVKESRLPK